MDAISIHLFFVSCVERSFCLIYVLHYRTKPHPKTEPLSSSLARPPWMYGMGRGRGIRPHQSPLALRGSYSLSLVRLTRRERHTLSQWSLRRGLRHSLYLRTFFASPIFYPRAMGVGYRCIPFTCCIHYIIRWLICQFILCKIE